MGSTTSPREKFLKFKKSIAPPTGAIIIPIQVVIAAPAVLFTFVGVNGLHSYG